MPVTKLLGMLSDWVRQGFVDENVWKDLSEFVSQEALINNESSPITTYNDEWALIEHQRDRILSHVSQYIYPSELKEFAVKRLGLRETLYEMIEEDHIYAKRRNIEVSVESNQTVCNEFFTNLILLKLEL